MLRGMEISSISVENLNKNKAEKINEEAKIQKITLAIVATYMLFFGSLYMLFDPIKDFIIGLGLGIQAIIVTLVMLGINRFLRRYSSKFPMFQSKAFTQMLQVYAFICILIALIFINEIPGGLFDLAM